MAHLFLILPITLLIFLTAYVPTTQGLALPVQTFQCPLAKTSNSSVSVENESGVRVIHLNEGNGRRVRIQFYYPNPYGRKRLLSGGGGGGQRDSRELPTTTSDGFETTDSNTQTTTEYKTEFDILCQWEFHTSNESYYLLLTFSKLSAPFSEDCKNAFVGMQKANGFESRWCGNRRQTDGRPTQLFSKSGAKISVYRSADAPASPPTGFSLTVEALDINEISNVQNPLRVLVG